MSTTAPLGAISLRIHTCPLSAPNSPHPATAFEPTRTILLISPGGVGVELGFLKPLADADVWGDLHGVMRSRRGEVWAGWIGVGDAAAHAASDADAAADADINTDDERADADETQEDEREEEEGTQQRVLTLHPFISTATTTPTTQEHPEIHILSPLTPPFYATQSPTARNLYSSLPVLGLSGEEPGQEKGPGAESVCIVLRAHDDEAGTRGLVIRVGQFVQGIIRQPGGIAMERWEWVERSYYPNTEPEPELGVHGSQNENQDQNEEDDDDENKGQQDARTQNTHVKSGSRSWKRIARTGDLFLPCAVTFRTQFVKQGGVVRAGGVEWVVEEVWG